MRCRCGRRWTGATECHCSACHEHFGGVGAFDKHRASRADPLGRYCADPATLLRRDGNPAFIRRDHALGCTWVEWNSTPHPFAAARVPHSSPDCGDPV